MGEKELTPLFNYKRELMNEYRYVWGSSPVYGNEDVREVPAAEMDAMVFDDFCAFCMASV